MKAFHIITFGCQMNEHDSERMAGILKEQGYAPAATAEDADLLILNTCSIREKAEQKFYSELGRLERLPGKTGKKRQIAVAGCIAQQEGAKIFSRASSVSVVVGPSDITRLPELLSRREKDGKSLVATDGDPEYHHKLVPASRADGIRAWVSIMYGCDNFCTYCVVPYLRGRERSRSPQDIVQEIRTLAAKGYREVTLLGQNVNSYGKGLAPQMDFAALLQSVHAVEGIERIRFVTSHPRDLSDRLIAAMRDLPKVCEALHLPAQSGSNRILAAMNRKYTSGEYRDKIARLRTAIPQLSLTTDIIVGFPGEGDDDFQQTIDLLREVEYDGIFAFKYSKRPKTAAVKFDNHLPERVKEERLEAVFALQREMTLRKNRLHIGAVQEVLVEGPSKHGNLLAGRTRGNKIVNMPGPAQLAGRCAQVKIISAGPNSLRGELCE